LKPAVQTHDVQQSSSCLTEKAPDLRYKDRYFILFRETIAG